MTRNRKEQSAPRRRKEAEKGFRISPSGRRRSLPAGAYFKSCRMKHGATEILLARLAFLSRSRRAGLARAGLARERFARERFARHDRPWRSASARRAHAKALRTLKLKPKRTRPYSPRINRKAECLVPTSLPERAKPVGMAGGGLRQAKPFVRTGRRPLRSSSTPLRHRRTPPYRKDPDKQPIETQQLWQAFQKSRPPFSTRAYSNSLILSDSFSIKWFHSFGKRTGRIDPYPCAGAPTDSAGRSERWITPP